MKIVEVFVEEIVEATSTKTSTKTSTIFITSTKIEFARKKEVPQDGILLILIFLIADMVKSKWYEQ